MMRPSEKIERDGWCQGEFVSSDGRVCATRAVYSSLGSREEGDSFLMAVTRRLEKSLIHWNDTQGRTKEEVIALLKEVEAEVYGIEHPVPWAEKGLAYASISSRAD